MYIVPPNQFRHTKDRIFPTTHPMCLVPTSPYLPMPCCFLCLSQTYVLNGRRGDRDSSQADCGTGNTSPGACLSSADSLLTYSGQTVVDHGTHRKPGDSDGQKRGVRGDPIIVGMGKNKAIKRNGQGLVLVSRLVGCFLRERER